MRVHLGAKHLPPSRGHPRIAPIHAQNLQSVGGAALRPNPSSALGRWSQTPRDRPSQSSTPDLPNFWPMTPSVPNPVLDTREVGAEDVGLGGHEAVIPASAHAHLQDGLRVLRHGSLRLAISVRRCASILGTIWGSTLGSPRRPTRPPCRPSRARWACRLCKHFPQHAQAFPVNFAPNSTGHGLTEMLLGMASFWNTSRSSPSCRPDYCKAGVLDPWISPRHAGNRATVHPFGTAPHVSVLAYL